MSNITSSKFVISVIILACGVASAEERPIDNTSQIEMLIAALASRNPEPKEGDGGPKGRMIFPLGYDLENERIPDRVANQLSEIGRQAFPKLMQHAQDLSVNAVGVSKIARIDGPFSSSKGFSDKLQNRA